MVASHSLQRRRQSSTLASITYTSLGRNASMQPVILSPSPVPSFPRSSRITVVSIPSSLQRQFRSLSSLSRRAPRSPLPRPLVPPSPPPPLPPSPLHPS